MKVFDPRKHGFKQKGRENALAPAQLQQDRVATERELDKALEDSFPASDPPAAAAPKTRRKRP